MSTFPWLDTLIGRSVRALGTPLSRRTAINFGSGFTVTDDPAHDQTTVTTSGGGGGGTVNLIVSTQTALKNLHASDLTDGQTVTVKATNVSWIWSAVAGAGMPGDDRTVAKLAETSTPSAGRFIVSGVWTPVTWFGADPSGAVDCATAFTAAANASRHIIVPPGTYKLTGWSVPRAGVTIDLNYGALLSTSDTIRTDFPRVHWRGRAFGFAFGSDGEWTPNVIWNSADATKPCMQWGATGHVDGGSLDGVLVDGRHAGVTTALWAYRIGTAGLASAGTQWGAFGAIDCKNGLHIRAAVEQSGFHTPYLGFRAGSEGDGDIGIGIGHDANYDGGITSTVVGDGGGTVSGFTKLAQLGGPAGRVSTVKLSSAFLVFETTRIGGALGVDVYDAFKSEIVEPHGELHGGLINTVSTAADAVISMRKPHGLAGGEALRITNAAGTTNVNGSHTVTSVVNATDFKIGVSTIGQTYAGGGIVQDLTRPNVATRIGHAGTAPEGCTIWGGYLAGAQYPIELIGFDKLVLSLNLYEVSGSGDATHLPYAIKNTGGGLRQVELIVMPTQVSRGDFYGGDLSAQTGLSMADLSNKDVNNDLVWQRFFAGTYESPTLRNPLVTEDIALGKDYTIAAIANTTPVQVQLSVSHVLRTGDALYVSGTGIGALDGNIWTVTYVAKDTVSLQGSMAAGTAAAGTARVVSSLRAKAATAFDIKMIQSSNATFRQDDNIPFVLRPNDDATAGATAHVPFGFQTYASVWNGSAPVLKSFVWVPQITAPNPFDAVYDLQLAGGSVVSYGVGVSAGLWWPFGQGNVRYKQGTAAPVAGAWAQGDVVINSTPTAGGNYGWVCTAPGTPGTWKTFGAIAA